jgi:uncharacterized protein (DUF983 family)
MSCSIYDKQTKREEQFKDNKCPECGQGLLLLRTMYKKICIDCNIEYEWTLKPGQLPLIRHQRG